jgi:GH15 family glucan-1,4-alpha-glucosidase
MIAAPTTSLPEMPEGSLNWDYRYCWVRDATFMLSALLNAGYRDDAVRWRDWMLRALGGATEHMHILYRVDGDRRMYEQTVPWLRGFAGAAPVVVGNDAAAQEQIDVVGEVLDALNLIERAGAPCSPETIAAESELMARLKHTWQDKDQGPWESRGPPQHYTYSIAMCSVGVDCFIRSASRRGHLSGAAVAGLCRLRDRIRSEAIERGWNHARGHFVHHYGGEQLDPSLLLLPLVGFLPANEPRMAATIDAIERDLSADGLVWRSPGTGETQQGAFIACSCWLADCRALQGRRTEAVALLERVLTLRNDVGLLSEGYHPGLRRLMGNFPQALSHIAVINTALGLTGPVLQRGGG